MTTTRPAFIRHVDDMPDNGGTVWPWTGSDEVLGVRTPLSRPLGLVRVGVHHDRLRPGERSSHPHAERWEEECVYVLEGRPDACIDGEWYAMGPDDIAVFAPGTGIEHTIANRTDDDVRLLVVGERIDTAHRAAEAWLAAWTAAEAVDVDGIFTADAEWSELATGVVRRGHGDIARGLEARRLAFGDTRVERGAFVPSARSVSLEWRWRAVHRAAYAGIDPSGHAVELRGVTIALLDGAKIARLTEAMDLEPLRRGQA